jgi:hypothetical protein
MNLYGKLRLETAAHREILGLLTDAELEDLKIRKRAGPITGLDATVLDLLDQAIRTRRLAASLKEE